MYNKKYCKHLDELLSLIANANTFKAELVQTKNQKGYTGKDFDTLEKHGYIKRLNGFSDYYTITEKGMEFYQNGGFGKSNNKNKLDKKTYIVLCVTAALTAIGVIIMYLNLK